MYVYSGNQPLEQLACGAGGIWSAWLFNFARVFVLRVELWEEGKKYNCCSPFAARRKAVTHSDGASYAANFL